MRSFAENRNIDGYKSMPKRQLIKLITTRTAFKIEEYITKLSKRELKDFTHYNYGNLTSNTIYEINGF